MTGLSIKPALLAGFLLVAALPITAQDYVDVEAERRAAAQRPEPTQEMPADCQGRFPRPLTVAFSLTPGPPPSRDRRSMRPARPSPAPTQVV